MKIETPTEVVQQSISSNWYNEAKENPCSEGEHVVKVIGVIINEEYGTLQLLLFTESGEKIVDRYNLKKENGENNKAVWGRLSVAWKALTGSWLPKVFDTDDIVGEIMNIEVEHVSNPNGGIYVNTGTMVEAESFTPQKGVEVPELIYSNDDDTEDEVDDVSFEEFTK
ncbi:MAG: hypothetical protein ACOCQD_03575 [archaeon]